MTQRTIDPPISPLGFLVELTAALTADAQVLLIRCSLRSGDTIQLASCLYLQHETGERIPFAAFDDHPTAAVYAEGLTLASFS